MQVTPLKKAVSILSLAILSLCILLTFPLKAALSSEEAAIKETRAVTEVAEEGLPEDFLPGTEYADTGCTCAAEGKEHSRFMINDDPYLYCLPVEKAEDGTIMVSLDHLAGVCGYTVSEENGSLTLAKEEYEYLLEKDSPWLICGSRIWALPVKPYESMDNLFVPLEFICDVLEDVDFTYEEETKILHLETEAETDQLTLSLTEEYTKRQTSVEAATIARCGEPFTVTVTFYHDSQRWEMSPPPARSLPMVRSPLTGLFPSVPSTISLL